MGEWVDTAGEWLRSQAERAAAGRDPRRGPATPSGEDLLRGAEPTLVGRHALGRWLAATEAR